MDYQPNVVFIDTEREKEIGLGPDWPFEPMKETECIINKEIANKYDIKVGDEITPHLYSIYAIQTIIAAYNREAPLHGWDLVYQWFEFDDTSF